MIIHFLDRIYFCHRNVCAINKYWRAGYGGISNIFSTTIVECPLRRHCGYTLMNKTDMVSVLWNVRNIRLPWEALRKKYRVVRTQLFFKLLNDSHGTSPWAGQLSGHLTTASSLESAKLTDIVIPLKRTIRKIKHKHTRFWNRRKRLSRKGSSVKTGEQVSGF